MVHAEAIEQIHAQALAALQERIRALAGREDRARKALHAVREERQKVETERAAIELAAKVYRRTMGLEVLETTHSEQRPSQEVGQVRARIGPQRYIMLVALRAASKPLGLDELAELTGLTHKRVKDQMVADEANSVVQPRWGRYAITDLGLNLLARYEDYKKRRGEELPSIESAQNDETEEEEIA